MTFILFSGFLREPCSFYMQVRLSCRSPNRGRWREERAWGGSGYL